MNAMTLHFFKLDGAGNDFVGLDWRGRVPLPTAEYSKMAQILTNRYTGIGADGVLVLQDPTVDGTDFTMLYLNADGSVGSMCGNGARCMAMLAHHLGAAQREMRFMTGAGVYRAVIQSDGETVALDFPDIPHVPERRTTLGPLRPLPTLDYIIVGVPHAVAFVEDLDIQDVAQMGRELRHDPTFAPAGANINFVEERGGVLNLRTYERGVEAETQACGTGSVATCCCHAAHHRLMGQREFTVIPTSGVPLRIGFDYDGTGFRKVTLTGPATIRYSGHCQLVDEHIHVMAD